MIPWRDVVRRVTFDAMKGLVERTPREDRMRRAVAHAAAVEQAAGHTSPEYFDELAAEYAEIESLDSAR